MEGWVGGWINEKTDGKMAGWIKRWLDGWMDERIDGWVSFFFLLFCVFQTFKNEKLVFLLSSKKRIVIFFKWSSTLLKFHHSYFDLFSPDVTF